MTPRAYLAVLLLSPAVLLTGCLLKQPVAPLKKAVGLAPYLDLQGHVAADANTDSVIPFDVVIVSDKKDAQKIGQMDAETWFGAKGRCNFSEGPKGKVQFHAWEFVPGQNFHIYLELKGDTAAIYSFAQYSSAGKHRVELTGKSLIIDMGPEGILTPTPNPSPQKKAPSAPERLKVCPDD
jgi:hypothetical protein